MANKYTFISDDIKYIGVDDTSIDLFEGQYVVPEGVSYNSYIILDDNICIMDTVDARKAQEWLNNLKVYCNTKTPDYLVILHCEPDHSSSIAAFLDIYPECTLVTSTKGRQYLEQFYGESCHIHNTLIVKEGDVLDLGTHKLNFIAAPFVHWPEVMMAYEKQDHVLFAADGFGKFGALCYETDDWACEARRYYFNIVGKYGAQVQSVLKKASALQIEKVCPLHGPVLGETVNECLSLYDKWSSYIPETEGVFIAYCSMHGNTEKAALLLAEELRNRGIKTVESDLARCDMAEAIEDAFRYSKMVLCAPTYDGDVMPVMSDFLHHLKNKNYQNRTIALLENGTWAPRAAKVMQTILSEMKDISFVEPVVTIHSSINDADTSNIRKLAHVL